MENVYVIWKSGYTVSVGLSVEKVAETDKAFKFKVLNSTKGYTFFMPKKAVKPDGSVDNLLKVAPWFKPEGFVGFLFDTYGSHYAR